MHVISSFTKVAGASALASVALAPFAASAMQARSSGQNSYHLVQLSVDVEDMSVEEFTEKTRTIENCNDARDLAREIDADFRRDRFVMPFQLPEDLLEVIEATPTGKATSVFGQEGMMRVLVVCNKA